jgi:hypothetical protein
MNTINEQRWMKLSGIDEEVDYGVYELEFDELDDNDKQLVVSFQSNFKAKINEITTSRSGKVASFLVKIEYNSYRFNKGDLQFLAESKIRWIEASGGYIKIGF